MSTLNLDAIRARADAATSGPWTVGVRWEDPCDVYWLPVNSPSTSEDDPHQPDRVALIRYSAGMFQFPHYDALSDAAFIAGARQDIPALLAEVDRLRAEVDRKEALRVELAAEVDRLNAELDERTAEDIDRVETEAWPASAPLPRRVPGEAMERECGWMPEPPIVDKALRTEGSES